MLEFFEALGRPGPVLNAVMVGLLASVACGVVGTYVVVRRFTYRAGGSAHCVRGGLGLAIYLRQVHGWSWLHPLHGAVAAALLAAAVIGIISLRYQQREDTLISAVWAIGMALGVLFIYLTPGYTQDLMSYLFGHIGLVGPSQLHLVAALDALVLALALGLYKQFQAICFDEQFARTRGLRVEAYYILLLLLTALTVVLLVTVVGIIMVIALLSLPAAVAGVWSRRLWQTMTAAVALSMIFTFGGLAMSFTWELAPGATVILLAGGTYALSMTASRLLRSARNHPPQP